MLPDKWTEQNRIGASTIASAHTVGALVIRIGLGGILHGHYTKEPPKIALLRPLYGHAMDGGIIEAPILDPCRHALTMLASVGRRHPERSRQRVVETSAKLLFLAKGPLCPSTRL